jgi:hypothetical protein
MPRPAGLDFAPDGADELAAAKRCKDFRGRSRADLGRRGNYRAPQLAWESSEGEIPCSPTILGKRPANGQGV